MTFDFSAPKMQNWHAWKDDREWRAWSAALNAEASKRGLEDWSGSGAGARDGERWRSEFEKGLAPSDVLDARYGVTR